MAKRVALAAICLASAQAFAQPTTDQPASSGEEPQKKEPGRGDFDAGGQARFPSGPDDMGEYKSFNWVAVDLEGRYYLLDQIWVEGYAPLAVKKPDAALIDGAMHDPSIVGGMQLRLEGKLAVPKSSLVKYETEIGLAVTLGYMREGAMLLSDKDFPLYEGGFTPGVALGVPMKVKMSSLLDFVLAPAWVYQSASMGSATAVQLPLALKVALGDIVKLSFDLGIYTGDDYSFRGSNGGRLSTGAALDVKVGPILLHTGAGVASLLTGPMYPSIGESIYVDVNAKYVK